MFLIKYSLAVQLSICPGWVYPKKIFHESTDYSPTFDWTFTKKNTQSLDQKVNQQQNTVCLEQQIYASPGNFTPMLLVMLETFRRSGESVKL